MATLKKLKASTLMETLVATVLIVIIVMISGLLLNNIFAANLNSNTDGVDNKIQELRYLYQNNKIQLPYYDDFQSWEIIMKPIDKSNQLIEVTIQNTITHKEKNLTFYEEKN